MALVERFDWLIVGERDFTTEEHEYPPDAVFERYEHVSFTRLFFVLAIAAAVVDAIRVGNPDTGIPYNYPLFAGSLYVLAVLLVLRKYHSILDETKLELIRILDRSSVGANLFERESDLTTEQINREINHVLSVFFSPAAILLGGLIGGIFTLAVMWALGVFQYYPYVLMNYAYGAGHGFFYGPIIGSVILIRRVSTRYIVDIDILAPDGIGGYGKVGDAIITLVIFAIVLTTFDFVILSSVSFVDEPLFQAAVVILYVAMILFFLLVTVYGVYEMRKSLLEVRDWKTRRLRDEFKEIENSYWQKVDAIESPEPESAHIETLERMFDRLNDMALWPINLVSLLKLAASTTASAIVVLFQEGYIEPPDVDLLLFLL